MNYTLNLLTRLLIALIIFCDVKEVVFVLSDECNASHAPISCN